MHRVVKTIKSVLQTAANSPAVVTAVDRQLSTDGGTANARLLHIRAYNNNNNNDYVYDAIIMTKVIARVHRVHLMNVD